LRLGEGEMCKPGNCRSVVRRTKKVMFKKADLTRRLCCTLSGVAAAECRRPAAQHTAASWRGQSSVCRTVSTIVGKCQQEFCGKQSTECQLCCLSADQSHPHSLVTDMNLCVCCEYKLLYYQAKTFYHLNHLELAVSFNELGDHSPGNPGKVGNARVVRKSQE